MTYTEIKFTIEPYEEPVADALIAELSNIGYDGFSYTDDGFTAYTDKASYNTEAIQNLEILQYFSEIYSIKTTVQEIEDQDC